MYKLLLVSDQEDVLEAFDQIHNWDYNGFRRPHVRHDLDGARESLQKHHADAIILGLREPEDDEKLLVFLREEYPLLPVCEAGRTPSEALEYLGELQQMLNYIRMDFSSDKYDEHVMMIRARRHLFRKLVGGDRMTTRQLYRKMRMLRSRMDPDKPCILMDLEQSALTEDRLVGRWTDSDHLLEKALFQSFGGDVAGLHVLPLVTKEGKIYVLAGALRGQDQAEDMTAVLDRCVREGIEHMEEYRGLHLRIGEIQIFPSLYAFCTDYAG